MGNGHSPAQAEWWASRCEGWNTASDRAIDVFAEANARLWAEIAEAGPEPWTRQLAVMTRAWARHRASSATVA